MASSLLSYAGWYLLPSLATQYLQTFYYTLTIRAGHPKPPPHSPRYQRDRRRIHIAVIVVYLVYTLFESDYQIRREQNFYDVLGVPFGVEEKALQSRFRRLTVQYHPDKVSGADAEGYYVHLKVAKDTLVEPVKRFAHDRLGPETLGWRSCRTTRDYVFRGLQQTIGYYVVSGAMLVLLGFLGYLEQGRFWRYMVMAGLFVVEMQTIMSPTYPTFLVWVNGVLVKMGLRRPYLPFEMLTLLRKLAITFFIALSQLGPLVQGPAVKEGEAVSIQQLNRLDAVAGAADQEVSRLMGLELSPFIAERTTMRGLRESVKEWLVQNTIRNDPEVKAAVQRVLGRRRGEDGSPPPVPVHRTL